MSNSLTTPWSVDLQAPLSMGFPREEYRILEWIAISLSRESSWLRDLTWISYIGSRILHHWATMEAQTFYRCCSVAQSCLTVCDPKDCSLSSLPFPCHLPEFTQIHVHYNSDAIQPSHPLMPFSSSLNLSQHQGLFQWVSCLH